MKAVKPGCNADACLLCRLCLKDWLPAVRANRQNFLLRKGEDIFHEGDEMKGIYFVYQGTVKVHKRWGPDKELIVRFATAGEIAGHRGLGKDLFFPVSATALERTTVCFIPFDFFQSSLKVNTGFLYELMLFYAEELKVSENNMRNLAHMPVKGRIAQSLLYLQKKFGTAAGHTLDIPLSRQDLASFAGTSYETLFRLMNEMSAENAISQSNKKITILNEDILRSYIAH